MTNEIWTFERAGQRMTVARWETAEGPLLAVARMGEPPQLCRFHDLPSLRRFQADMETFLLKTNWSFVSFSPDRRLGGDRRGFPRMDERRRWWTDSVDTAYEKVVWGKRA